MTGSSDTVMRIQRTRDFIYLFLCMQQDHFTKMCMLENILKNLWPDMVAHTFNPNT